MEGIVGAVMGTGARVGGAGAAMFMDVAGMRGATIGGSL